MNKYILITVILFSAYACIQPRSVKENISIAVSILPLKYFVETISAGDFDVNVIVPPGVGPETFDPTPLQMKYISNSEIYFQIGLIDFEKSISNGIVASIPNLKIVNLSQGMDVIAGSCSHGHSNNHQHSGVDPHVWLSPKYVKIMTTIIASELSKINPDSTNKYYINSQRLISSIDSIDMYIRQSFNNLRTNKFIVYHPSLTYYARDYSLEQLSIEDDGKEPSSEHMKSLFESIESDSLTVVLYPQQSNESTVMALSEHIDLQSEPFDPLAYDWKANILKITDILKKSMSENDK